MAGGRSGVSTVNTSDVVTTGETESVSFSLIFNLRGGDFATSQYEGGPGGVVCTTGRRC